MAKFIVYINADREISVYQIENERDSGLHYFKAFCLDSYRLLTFRKDRIINSFSTYDAANQFLSSLPESDRLSYEKQVDSHRNTLKHRVSSEIQKLVFCFTGFKQAQKDELIALAQACDFRTVDSVTSKTNFLVVCCQSETVGPTKLTKAREHDVKIIYEDQFYHMLETGEIPDSAITFPDTIFTGKLISFDGDFSFNLAEVKAKLTAIGAFLSAKVTNKTDFLVIGIGAKKKLIKAQEMGVCVVNEQEFKSLFDFIKIDL
jgi:DNA ligase (NAD+)|nr:MAG TPA: DNA ligase-like protein [Caudoviricetes sp.]